MTLSIIMLVFSCLLLVGIPVGLFFAIRALLRYNAQLHRKKSMEKEELDRMKIDDL